MREGVGGRWQAPSSLPMPLTARYMQKRNARDGEHGYYDERFNAGDKLKDQILLKYALCFYNLLLKGTIFTSDRELMESTYMVTPTSTGGPENDIIFNKMLCNRTKHSVCSLMYSH